MASTIQNGEIRHRPGGRTAETSDRIAAAIVELLVERGADECTFTNVAEIADVERSTLYRRYQNRWDMISQALFRHHRIDFAIEATGDFRADMTAHLHKIAASLESTPGRAMVVAAAMARVDRAPEGGRYWSNRRDQLQPVIDAAVKSGQIRPGIEPDELFAASDGPLFFRMLIAAAPVDEVFIAQVVDNLCALYCLPGRCDGSPTKGEIETPS
jgi:AcrR family transcriptional regulator